jgi:ubiquinone/menaquinone biosynthesis C-methylase UbiE
MEKALAKDANYLKQVREQYENFPYPPRNPENEKTQFIYEHLTALSTINHYHYSGKKDFSKGFRGLVAGGGTGDAIIMLAEQCRDMKADIVYLDISKASMEIAQSRAKIRGLTNIEWIHGSILDVPKILDGKFDFINCSGVLHHLESPEAGLKALASVLEESGVMALLLYAQYGRESVYQIQKLMRMINNGEENMQRKVDNCKAVLRNLPDTHAFKPLMPMMADLGSDIGIYDLFLHSNDVAYTIPQLYAFLSKEGLAPTHFFFGGEPMGNFLYNPDFYITDNAIKKILGGLSEEERHTTAELIHGQMIKHMFYAARTKPETPSPYDLDNVPSLSQKMRSEAYQELYTLIKATPLDQKIGINAFGLQTGFTKSPHAERIFQLIDGARSIGSILEEVINSCPPGQKKPIIDELKHEFAAIFFAFNVCDWMFLRHKSVPAAKNIFQLLHRG